MLDIDKQIVLKQKAFPKIKNFLKPVLSKEKSISLYFL